MARHRRDTDPGLAFQHPFRTDRGHHVDRGLAHGVEEQSIRVQLVEHVAHGDRIGHLGPPAGGVPRVVVEEHAYAPVPEEPHQVGKPRHIIEVELVAIVQIR